MTYLRHTRTTKVDVQPVVEGAVRYPPQQVRFSLHLVEGAVRYPPQQVRFSLHRLIGEGTSPAGSGRQQTDEMSKEHFHSPFMTMLMTFS